MSLFKKPKKNIRQRVALNSDEENEDSNDIILLEPNADPDDSLDGAGDSKDDVKDDTKLKDKKKKKKHQEKAVISFVDEEEDGEVFQVKKSSHSRRLAKQIEREKRRKEQLEKEANDESAPQIKVEPQSPPSAANPAANLAEVKSESDRDRCSAGSTILSGRDAEMAGYRSDEDDGTGDARPLHPFLPRSAGSLQRVLQDGAIPDAATIHAVRKRREQARRLQEASPDFIAVNEESQGSGSRPVREDDDSGPEDDRITFSVSTTARDREARRDQFNAARDQEDARDSNEDDTELARWENQQIKKAFSSAQLASVHAEHYLLPTNGDDDAGSRLTDPLGQRQRRPLADLTPALIRQRLAQKLSELKLAQTGQEASRDTCLDQLIAGQSEIDRLEKLAPKAERRYKYYQDIRGYVTDLVECFNEKLPLIEELENKMLEVLRARSQKLVLRRRIDIRDQKLELDASTQKGGVHFSEQSAGEVAARRRRTAEREGRRTRRRRARELSAGGGAGHQDGLSSDDETASADVEQFQKDRDAVLRAAPEMLVDVEDEFSTLAGVCRHFAEWRRVDPAAYRDAYVSLSLPRALTPIVRLQMIGWSPLHDTEGTELEKFAWFTELATFGVPEDSGADTEEGLGEDPDCLLLSRVTERVVLPKITALVERVWDPLSNSETLRLVHLVRQLARDFPTITGESVHLQRLLKAVVGAFQRAIEEDVSLPRFSAQALESRSTPSAVFFYRQFTSCCKLLGNMLSWTELIADAALQRLALGSLLNGVMLLPLTQVPDPAEAVTRCRLVASALPSGWFQAERSVPELNMFVSYLTILAVKVASGSSKTAALTAIGSILKKLGATGAQAKVAAMMAE